MANFCSGVPAATVHLAPKTKLTKEEQRRWEVRERLTALLRDYQGRYAVIRSRPSHPMRQELLSACRDFWEDQALEIGIDPPFDTIVIQRSQPGAMPIIVSLRETEPAESFERRPSRMTVAQLSGLIIKATDQVGHFFVHELAAKPVMPPAPPERTPLSAMESAAALYKEYRDIFAAFTRQKRLLEECKDKVRPELFQGLIGRSVELRGRKIVLDEDLVKGLQEISAMNYRDIQKITGVEPTPENPKGIRGLDQKEWAAFLWALYTWAHLDFQEDAEGLAQMKTPPGPDGYRRQIVGEMILTLPAIMEGKQLTLATMHNFVVRSITGPNPTIPIPEDCVGFRTYPYPEAIGQKGTFVLKGALSHAAAGADRIEINVENKYLRDLRQRVEQIRNLPQSIARKLEILKNPQRFDVESRVEAVRVLVEDGPDLVFQDLVDALLTDPSSEVREKLIMGIISSVMEINKPTKGMFEQFGRLKEYAKKEDVVPLRKDLAANLHRVDHPVARDILLILVQDPDPKVRVSAILSLGETFLDEEPTIQALVRMARHDPEPGLKASADKNLDTILHGDFLNEDRRLEITFHLLADPDEGVQLEGIERLRKFPRDRTIEALLFLITDEDSTPAMREAAAQSLYDVLNSPRIYRAALPQERLDELNGLVDVLQGKLQSDAADPLIGPLAQVVGLTGNHSTVTTFEFYLRHQGKLSEENRLAIDDARSKLLNRLERASEFSKMFDRIRGLGTEHIADQDIGELAALMRAIDPMRDAGLESNQFRVSLWRVLGRLADPKALQGISEERRGSLERLISMAETLFPSNQDSTNGVFSIQKSVAAAL